MLRFFLCFLALTVLFPGNASPASEQGESLQSVVTALERPFQASIPAALAIRDFQGDFLQESHLVSLDRTQQGRGRVAVKFLPGNVHDLRRTLFSWLYEEPEKQEIISNGRTLWVYVPENRQVIQSSIPPEGQKGSDDPMSFLTGLGNLSRDFVIDWADPRRDPAGNFILALVPRDPSPLIQRLHMTVSRDAVKTGEMVFPLRAVTVFDPGGNTTFIQFSNVQINQGLPDSRFEFTVPEGVEIVHPAPAALNH